MRCCLHVVDDRVRRDDHLVTRSPDAPAEVDVFAEHRQRRVEPPELVPDVAAHEHPGGADGQHLSAVVVLALVRLVPLEPGLAAPATADADTELEQLPAVSPAPDLGTDDGGGGVALRRKQEVAQGIGLGGAVVVQEP